VHLAPVADEVDPLTAQHFPDASVLLTPQGWLRRWDEDGRVRFKRWFERQALAAVNCVVFSEEDIAAAPDLEAAFADAVEDVFVTRAERGGTHYHAGIPNQYDTPQVQMVHPTGAGDIFAAAVLASRYRLGSMKAAIPVAAALAAQSVTRVGLAGVPTPEAVAEAVTAYHDRTHSV
jgi:sugar/nucleoside kinase (ribokinase family)